ncbi:MAG: glycosyltransferase [Bacilli bacterium]
MRVMIFTDTYPPEINGVATSSRNLASVLRKNGNEVLVVTTNPFSKDVTYEEGILRIPGIELTKLYGYRLAWLYNSKAMDVIRVFKGDVIHVQTDAGIGQFGYIVGRNLKIPTVYTYHTMYEEYTYYATKGHFDRVARNVVRLYTKSTIEKVDEFITPSQKTKDYLRSIGVDATINVVPTGIDFSIFKEESIDQEKLAQTKKELGINRDDITILSLGRVAKEKSIDVCLKGFAEYVKQFPDAAAKFVIVGGGPALEGLIQLAKDLSIDKKVIFTGAVNPDIVPFYYRLGDVFISASITETQGLTYMEAMASDLIVLARFDNNLLGVINDNKTGFFFTDENDCAHQIDKIIHLTDEKRKEIVDKTKKTIEPFSFEAFYKNIMGVYLRAIKKSW